MRLAVLADVHANAQALDAVLDAMREEKPDLVVCLGDLVGYNADPAACVARVRAEAHVVVAGNHDRDALRATPVDGTSALARTIQRWTAEQLDASARAYLEALPAMATVGDDVVAVHGCYLNPEHVSGYVTSTMLEANLRALAEHVTWPKIALCGHTHAPLCGWLDEDRCEERSLREPTRWPARARAVLVNPGSVGQPRDGDPRAAFAVVDLEARSVEVRRVPYDVASAARAIARSGLPPLMADRLREGR